MSGPGITVEIPPLDEARIVAMAELLLRLIDNDGVIAGADQPRHALNEHRRRGAGGNPARKDK